jgi:ribose 5-phosphate isomerase B
MLIYIGADHRGFQLKEVLKSHLNVRGYEAVDCGNERYEEGDDYPDFAATVAKKVSENPEENRGILICGSGVGVDIVANKFKGVRSALATTPEQARLSRHDNNANVLSLAADFLSENKMREIVNVWLETSFSGEEHHKRRLQKINSIY